MDANTLIDMLENAGRKVRAYSGRGMYGRACVGVEVDNIGELFRMGLEVADDDTKDVDRWALQSLKVSCDAMGLGTILYFPDIKWPNGREDTDDESDQDGDVDDDTRSFGPAVRYRKERR